MIDKADKLEQLFASKTKEKEIREKNPIVKQAWERYQEVLELYMKADTPRRAKEATA
jgi:hypothetical protein